MDDCIFCKIANGEISSTSVYEDSNFKVILDLNPATKGHALILPKKHFKDITELDEQTASKVIKLAARIGKAMMSGLGCSGFNVVQNNGVSAGQTVFHFHIHIIPRYDDGVKIVEWEPHESNLEELKSAAQSIESNLI